MERPLHFEGKFRVFFSMRDFRCCWPQKQVHNPTILTLNRQHFPSSEESYGRCEKLSSKALQSKGGVQDETGGGGKLTYPSN